MHIDGMTLADSLLCDAAKKAKELGVSPEDYFQSVALLFAATAEAYIEHKGVDSIRTSTDMIDIYVEAKKQTVN